MIKRLLQKGADREKINNKGLNSIDIATIKDNKTINDIIQNKFHCQLCSIKMPYIKIEKNIWNLIFFMSIHIIVEFFTFFLLTPCIY